MDGQRNNDAPAAPSTAGCTPLERRLTSWCCFLYVLLLHIFLRIFVWPFISGTPYLIYVVLGTRLLVGVSWVRLHQHLTREKEINVLVQTAVGLTTILVDFGLGSCYFSCTGNAWVTREYCKYR